MTVTVETVVERESALDLDSRGAGKGSIRTAPGGGEALARQGSHVEQEKVDPVNESLLDEEGILSSQPKETDMGAVVDEDGVPSELKGRQFADVDALHDELETLGLTDYKFLLDSEGFVTMPDPEHNGGTRFIRLKLDRYSKGLFGKWGFVDPDNVQQVNRLTATGRTAKREPDVNFWHHQKCAKVGGELKVRKRPGSKFDLDPDVFFQFSWGNKEEREFAAMNDILTLGGVGAGNAGPRVGFLVKVRIVDGNNVGIDVYKVYNGRTVADAIAQTHSCTHTYYDHATGDNATIEIPAADFGFTGFWGSLFPSFKLSLQELWEYAELG